MKRLCILCEELITPDENFEILSEHEKRLVVIDKTTGRSHVLMSKRMTALILRRQRKLEPKTWVRTIEPVQAPTPVEESVWQRLIEQT